MLEQTPGSLPPGKALPATPAPSREQAIVYYDRIKKQLRDLIHSKRHNDKQLSIYEENIYKAETAYLEETPNGNIVKGFDNYIKAAAPRRKTNFNDQDRIFSLSSITYAAKLQSEESAPVTAASTPTVPDLPRLQTQNAASRTAAPSTNKKNPNRKRKVEDDESASVSEVETPGPKRVRISFSGQNGQQ
ncbi:histone acetyltransferase subunit NuA4-domain-containing protein [Pyronema omphalodes]|nr:histone acetyltransferase subunit NuA4-domain-containing protein [Pyronema omphalodes]